jgi:hypothetical protein
MHGAVTNGRASLKGGAAKRAKSAPGTRAKGKTAADRTIENGGSTPAADTVKQAKQYEAIYNAWRRGIDCTTLAQRHDLSPRRVQQICDELRASSIDAMDTAHPLAGIRYTDRLLVQLDAAVTTAAEILEGALADKNWAVAVGASRRVAEARRELLELQQQRGIVPRNLGLLAVQADGVATVQRILRVFDQYGVPGEVRDAIADLVELDVTPDGRLELDMRSGQSDVIDGQEVT